MNKQQLQHYNKPEKMLSPLKKQTEVCFEDHFNRECIYLSAFFLNNF